MSLTERIKVEHLVRCACGVLAMDRASLPEPCQEHGELAVVEYVRADTYQGAVEALRDLVAEVEFAFPASVDRRGLRQALDRALTITGGQ